MRYGTNGLRVLAVALVPMLLPGATLAQESRPHIGLGYVANAPELFAGGAVYGVAPDLLGGLGLYVDAKFATEHRPNNIAFEPELTVEQVENEFGDLFRLDDEDWYNINAAVIRPLTEQFAAYLGAGYASVRRFNLYQINEGDTQARGFGGIYWVEDVDAAETLVNVLGGALININDNINAQFGVERYPRGVTVGLSYRFTL